MAKQYGLIKPSNVFGSDSDDDSNSPAVKKQPVLKPNLLQKKQIQKMHEQAVEEDPSIFLYDEVYDDIQNKKNEAKNQKKTQEDKKPKYIKKLIETAEKRKKEYERRVERQVQKEREAEGEKFKDKEIFVTSTYRKKLEEIKEAELEEKRQEYLESIGDVTKQADLSGFYRHLYAQKLETEPKQENVKTEKTEDVDSKPETTNLKRISEPSQKKKNYRKRESSNDDEPTISVTADEKPAKTEHLNSNLDADSDFSVDSSSDESESEKNKKPAEKIIPKEEDTFKEPMKPVEKVDIQESIKTDKNEIEIEELEVKPKKPKIDIWAKRTVGDAFLEAVKRYYERKALKESGLMS